MNVIDYLDLYKDTTFKEMAFNEIDALALAMASYVSYEELNLSKEKISSSDLIELVKGYIPNSEDSQRKRNYLKVVELMCEGKRYKEAVYAHYRKLRDSDSAKQFQAITIIFKDFIYISFCGTDSTLLGWKEDFNMAILETVPSEIEAIKYANDIASKHWFKRIYFGGHSKGGRLAITAAKGLVNKKRIAAIFPFDAPNYPPSCYDAEYKKIDSYIVAFAPNESIIGRLMEEYHQKRIVKSTNSLLMQHDAFSWLVQDRSFVYEGSYNERSSRIVNAINHTLTTSDEETKHQFIDSLFDYFAKLEIEKLPNEKDMLPFIVKKAPALISEWRNLPKENRSVVKKIIFEILKDYLLNK